MNTKEYNHKRWLALKSDPEKYKEHQEKHKSYVKNKMETDPVFRSKRLAYDKKYKRDHPKMRRQALRKWRAKHPGIHKIYYINARLKMIQNNPEKLKIPYLNKQARLFYAKFYAVYLLSQLPKPLPECCYKPTKSHQFINPAWY